MLRKIHVPTLAAVTGLAAAMLAGPAGTAAAAPALAATATGEIGFSGSAYGTEVTIAGAVKSGRSALATIGCVSQTGVSHTNTVASVSVPPLLTSGTIDTSAASETTATGVASTSSATVQGVNALGGLVQATTVESVSTTGQNSTTGAFSTSAAGTEFVGLEVAGQSIQGTPAPNTKISLPGVGYVILNQQTSAAGKLQAHLNVTAIHVYVTETSKSYQVGTQVVVAAADSGLGGPVSGLLDGLAYGAHASVAKTVIAGEQFPQTLSCLGTDGKTKTNSAASVTIPGILTSGTVTDSVAGQDTAKTASAAVSSEVQGLNLLSSTVTATVIEADVTATGNPPAFGDTSDFTDLTVAGHPGLGSDVPPNTKLSLAGIGTLWLHRQIKTATKITVIMVQLVVTNPSNPAGLKVGTTVNVAYAQASVN
jgi:hypothetical protein